MARPPRITQKKDRSMYSLMRDALAAVTRETDPYVPMVKSFGMLKEAQKRHLVARSTGQAVLKFPESVSARAATSYDFNHQSNQDY
eukprot:6174181-Pleurochrysis_carterae.AAC.3